jgi:hypothetical protein
VLTWDEDGIARLWEVERAALLGSPIDHPGRIAEGRFDRDGRRILLWSSNGLARLYNSDDGAPLGRPMVHGAAITGASFTADETRVLTWSQDDTARLWSVANGQCLAAFPHTDSVTAASFNPDETRLLTAGGLAATVWDMAFDRDLPLPMRVLELEVRTAAKLGVGGQLQILSTAEWNTRQAALLEQEIASGKTIEPPGDARLLSADELAQKRARLARLRAAETIR